MDLRQVGVDPDPQIAVRVGTNFGVCVKPAVVRVGD